MNRHYLTGTHLSEFKRSLDLAAIIEVNGTELRRVGGDWLIGLCPFHTEKTPSFIVYTDSQRYHCFGRCGAGGDAIDFIQNLHSCDFKEACSILGFSFSRSTRTTRKKITQIRKDQVAKRAYKLRERDLAYTLGTLIRWTHAAMGEINTMDDAEDFAEYFHALPFWEQCHLVLCTGEPVERRKVVEALKDLDIIERTPLFEAEFDYRSWEKSFCLTNKQEGPHEEINRIKIQFG